jgi:hypothetical protein
MYINEILPEQNTDNIQGKSIHKIESIILKYGLTISTSKTKTMIFTGSDSIRSKTLINYNMTEQISIYNCLGCSL